MQINLSNLSWLNSSGSLWTSITLWTRVLLICPESSFWSIFVWDKVKQQNQFLSKASISSRLVVPFEMVACCLLFSLSTTVIFLCLQRKWPALTTKPSVTHTVYDKTAQNSHTDSLPVFRRNSLTYFFAWLHKGEWKIHITFMFSSKVWEFFNPKEETKKL